MIGNRSVLAVIAGRGRSKGLPGKNIADLGGKPVVAWSVAAGKASRYVDRLILSSDDPEIMAAARVARCEVPFMRPKRLATDMASIYDVLFHAIRSLEESYDYIVLLQAASPFRSAGDIDACIALCDKTGAAIVSVSPAAKPPQWMYTLASGGRLRPVLKARRAAGRRQDLLPVYLLNGAVYVAKTSWLNAHRNFMGPETRAYVMPSERSIDIDTHIDLLLARAIIADTSLAKRRKS